MGKNYNVVLLRGRIKAPGRRNMRDQEIKVLMIDGQRGFFYLSKEVENFLQSFFLSITVSKNSFHRAV